MSLVIRKNKKVFTVEFTTFVVQADSKDDAFKTIKKYINKKCNNNLSTFLNMRAKVTEKEIFAN